MLVLCICTGTSDWGRNWISNRSSTVSCNIITGYTVGGKTSTKDGDCVHVSPGKTVLISPETPQGTQYTRTITVAPGEAVLIEAFNLVEDYHLYVNRVIRSSECAKMGCACDPQDLANTYGAEGSISFRTRMTLGNSPELWSLIKYSDATKDSRLQLMITVPGMYELELEEPDTQLAQGLTWVDYQRFRLEQVGTLPFAYQAGVK